ncbi:MAG: AraC family transcriptional regulator [Cyclobacteriaceae bacterium]|nr:AraC family transcriptional regulator [Cyclobacteriaceae bacterium]
MIYKSFLPSPCLSDFVRNYTVINFDFTKNETPPTKHRSPKPEQKIVFYIKGRVNLLETQNGRTRTPPPVSIYNHQRDKRNLQVTSEFLAFIIYLQPGVLHRLLEIPMSNFPGDYLDAELVFNTEVRLISEQLAAAESPLLMISVIEQFLLSKSKRLVDRSPIDAVAKYILSGPTSFSLDAIANQANLSTKQFYRNFVQRIGMTPKLFSRLTRFNHAYQYKLVNPATTWSSIAQEYGYTDYHHMEKEFKEFIGATPKEWVNTELKAPERLLKLR